MNQKKISIKLIIIIILIILLIVISGFGFEYLKTDFLKSNKSLFIKYATQIADNDNGFIDNDIIKYMEKNKNTSYRNNGKFTFAFTSDDESLNNQMYKVNNINISFDGQIDASQSKFEENISLNYSENVNFPITLKKVENIIGFQTDYVGKKYITVDSDKLDELEYLDYLEDNHEVDNDEDVQETEETNETENYSETNISSTTQESLVNVGDINIIKNIFDVEFSQQEIEYVYKRYKQVIENNLLDSSFTKVKENGKVGYKLTLNEEEQKKLFTNILENLKGDEITLNKMNEYLSSIDDSAKISIDDIDELIDTIDYSNYEEITITVYKEKNKLSKLEYETEQTKVSVEKIKQNNELKYDILVENKANEGKINFIIKYNGLNSNEVSENYELKLEGKMKDGLTDDENIGFTYQYNFNNNILYDQTTEIENFTSDNSLNLNELDDVNKTNLVNAIKDRFELVNKKLMEDLGVREDENPIIYAIPTLYFYSQMSNSQLGETSDFSNMMDEMNAVEINSYNSRYEKYEGNNLTGATVKGLLTEIASFNGLNDDDEEYEEDEISSNDYKIKEINFNGEEYSEITMQTITALKDEIKVEDGYKVEFEKDESTGAIYRAVINKK